MHPLAPRLLAVVSTYGAHGSDSDGARGDEQSLESQRLERLIEAGRALVSMLDLESLLERVLHTAREVTGARYAALGILDEPRESLERFITLGIDDDCAHGSATCPPAAESWAS